MKTYRNSLARSSFLAWGFFAALVACSDRGQPERTNVIQAAASDGMEEPIIGYGYEPAEPASGGVLIPGEGIVAEVSSPEDIPAGADEPQPEADETAPLFKPAHFGHYCSMTWAEGGWGMAWDTSGNDPCGWIEENSDPGGTVARAGMFDAEGVNRVVGRCGPQVFLFEGVGTGPLDATFWAMVESGRPDCIMTVAPLNFPIAKSPFYAQHEADDSHEKVGGGSGFDFEMDTAAPNYDMDPTESLMNNVGDWKSSGSPDDHKGNDFSAPGELPLYPVASGEIFALNTYVSGSCSSPQEEVYIEHTVITLPMLYAEKFLSYYAHVDYAPGLSVGAFIGDYETIGEVGDENEVGCGSAPHLHFGIMKITNTTWRRNAVVNAMSSPMTPCGSWPWACGESYSGKPFTFESFGYHADLSRGKEFDPYSWRGADPWGALSSNIWIEGLEPPKSADWF